MTKDLKLDKSVAVPKKRKKIASLDRRKARAGWFFVLPFILGFVLIYLPMIYDSIVMSLSEIHMAEAGVGGYTLEFVGLRNYINSFTEDPYFAQRLVEGLQTLAFDIPAILIFSLFMAVMLNQKMVGRAVFRSIFFVPVIISTGIMNTIAAQDILNNYMGSTEGIDDGSGSSAATELVSAIDLQMLFANMKVGTEIVEYVVTAINNIFNIVNRSGVQMLIFLSGLQSINPAIYESCKIDGATSWETFWKITFPMISPMILVNGIYTIIDSFTNEQNAVMAYIAKKYTEPGGDVMSSAMAWMYFLIVIAVVAVIGAIFSAFVFYGRKSE
ncbi:MAG: sugar ABC transporter permease [Clostridia bacterium]|nr:sugar ABC transporter permease [Clostridia bacterium]